MLDQEKDDWDFKGVNTKYSTHGIHYYPARMIPQIASRLIRKYTQPYDLILDPFCGSGTVLLECELLNRWSIGIDINPLACLITNVKTSPLTNFDFDFESIFKKVNQIIPTKEKNKYLPNFKNLTYWFSKKSIDDLSIIKYILYKVKIPKDILKLLLICFSRTVHEVSKGIFDGSSTHLRKNLQNFSPNVFESFKKNVVKTLNKMSSLNKLGNSTESTVLLGDSSKISLKSCSIDCIITSPPYGEEKNTIGYMRWTKFSLYWLGYTPKELLKLKKKSLGARRVKKTHVNSKYFSNFLKDLKISDRRMEYLNSFFLDYSLCLKEMFRTLKPNRFCCIVIGNRTIAKKPLFLDKITKELAQKIGFKTFNTYYRRIPTKTIPWSGISGKTIKKENIIILKKPKN